MRRGAGFDANQAWRQSLEECQDVSSLQLPAQDHLAGRVNSMHLKDRLGDIETDCRNRLHSWLLRIVGTLSGTPHLGTLVPVEQPSTASWADQDRASRDA